MININDSPPKLSQDTYEAVLLLPTYMGVEVLKVEAYDPDLASELSVNPDKSITPRLVYSLEDSNVEYFSVERFSGVVTVINPNLSKDRYQFNIKVCITSSVCSRLRLAPVIMISTGSQRTGSASLCTQSP